MMNVTFITTVDHNIGDDFVREGIKFLLKKAFPKNILYFQNIHKHSPITVRNGFEWFKKLKISKFSLPTKKIDSLLPLSISRDKILEADLVVQSGAPVYWCHKEYGSHCADNEWYDPLIRRRFSKNHEAKLLNIAAGSCQDYNSDGIEFNECSKDIEYIKEFYSTATLTTVRDKLAYEVLNSLGLQTSLIPCPSIFAIDEYALTPIKKKYLIINYMQLAGHFTFGKEINIDKWYRELKTFYNNVKDKEDVLFVCHNKNEIKDVKNIDPGADIFYSDNFVDYMKVYGTAKYGIMNRVHGAFLMASFGAPSFIIGNDSRARMAAEIGLESMFIDDVNAEILLGKYEQLKKSYKNFKSKFEPIKTKAYEDYIYLLSKV